MRRRAGPFAAVRPGDDSPSGTVDERPPSAVNPTVLINRALPGGCA
jgi:hypothetical protein